VLLAPTHGWSPEVERVFTAGGLGGGQHLILGAAAQMYDDRPDRSVPALGAPFVLHSRVFVILVAKPFAPTTGQTNDNIFNDIF